MKKGEVVGIIGRNGAGKSTLLKILSRITTPTEGTVEVHGRIGSLLEVGTGFHPELSGRENIYLSGSILGMKRTEIDAKFDEIVRFAEMEKFLDTPVKRYSSGMYVRLAFAVAAHLEPEILIVDEVLAVGDAAFQKKCLGKMGDVAKEGRTVLFVSHNMAAVASLCTKGFLLSDGRIIAEGDIQKIISKYLENSAELDGLYEKPSSMKNGKISIDRVLLKNADGVATSFYNTEVLKIEIVLRVNQPLTGVQIAVEILNEHDIGVLCTTNLDADEMDTVPVYEVGQYVLECPIRLSSLRKGRYHIRISSSIPNIEMLDIVEKFLYFEIVDDPPFMVKLNQTRTGVFVPLIEWTEEKVRE